MRTIRTKVYNFEELVVDAQQNAIEQYQSQNNEDCLRIIEKAKFSKANSNGVVLQNSH